MIRNALRLTCIWLALVTAMFAFTSATDVIPDERIAGKLLNAAEEGRWVTAGANGYGLVADRYTECVAFTQGLGNSPELTSRWQYIAADLTLGTNGCEGVIERLALVAQGEAVTALPYLRYWHGYVLLTRPLLAYTDVATMRTVIAALLAISMCLMLLQLTRTLGGWAAAAFAAPLLLTADFFGLPESLHHSISWTVLLVSAVVAMRWADRGRWALATVGVLSGSVYVFFDFLLYPSVALMMIMFGVLAASVGGAVPPLRTGRRVVLAGVCWSVGYVVTWVAKWVISALIFGLAGVVDEVGPTIAFRISGDYELVNPSLGAAVSLNWATWMDQMWLVPLVAGLSLFVVAVCAALVVSKGRPGSAYMLLYVAVSLVPVAWLIVVSNHSQIHTWFVYRLFPSALACLTAGAVGLAMSQRANGTVLEDNRAESPKSEVSDAS